MDEVEIFKKNLFWIRCLFDWTDEELGKKIGVTRQCIVMIEHDPKYRLSKANYYAMRYFMDVEIFKYPISHIRMYEQLLREVFKKEKPKGNKSCVKRLAREILFT